MDNIYNFTKYRVSLSIHSKVYFYEWATKEQQGVGQRSRFLEKFFVTVDDCNPFQLPVLEKKSLLFLMFQKN